MTDSSTLSIDQRLKQVRNAHGWTQAEFAERLAIPTRTYKNYELGIRDLPIGLVVTICKTLNVSSRWLLVGEGEMNHQVTIQDWRHVLEYSVMLDGESHTELTDSFHENKIDAEDFKRRSLELRNKIKANDALLAEMNSFEKWFLEKSYDELSSQKVKPSST